MTRGSDPPSRPAISRRAVLFGGPLSAALLTSSEASAVGRTGLPPGSAHLFFYHSGTSTPAPVYAASSLTIEHPRPIIAASPASLPAIYCDEALAYRLVVRDMAGNLVQDVDPVVPVAVARSPSNQGASNSVVMITPQQFGAVADDLPGVAAPTDNLAAFQAAFAYLETLALKPSRGVDYQALPELYIPLGYYYCSDSLQLKSGRFNIKAALGSRIRFPANKHGIIIHAYNTIGERKHDTARDGPYKRASASYIFGLSLAGGGGADRFKHGFYIRTGVHLDHCAAIAFPGNGAHIAADVGGDARGLGNANLWRLSYSIFSSNGLNGVFCDYGDSNAGTAIGLDCQYNARWGIYDSSFLGNTWIGCHTDSNGVYTHGGPEDGLSKTATQILHRGFKYAVRLGQDAQASSTEPGTNDKVWYRYSEGTAHPDNVAWARGGTYASGGSYAADDPNARSIFIGCYEEGTQAPAQIYSPSMVVGGFLGNDAAGGGLKSNGGVINAPALGSLSTRSDGKRVVSYLGGNPEEGRVATFANDKHAPGVNFAWINVDQDSLKWIQHGAGTPRVYEITHYNTKKTFGRETPVPHAFSPTTLMIGERLHHAIEAVADLNGVDLARGDIFYFRNPVAGGKLGVVVVKAGKGGSTAVIKGFGSIDD